MKVLGFGPQKKHAKDTYQWKTHLADQVRSVHYGMWQHERVPKLPKRQEEGQALVKQTRKMASSRRTQALPSFEAQTRRVATIKLATAQTETHLYSRKGVAEDRNTSRKDFPM